jgi:hypothetical protein
MFAARSEKWYARRAVQAEELMTAHVRGSGNDARPFIFFPQKI